MGLLHQLQEHLDGAGLACKIIRVMQQEVVVMLSPLSFSPLRVYYHLISKFGAALGLRAVRNLFC